MSNQKEGVKMVQIVFGYVLPIMIALTFVSFLWAWMLTAVKPPQKSEENCISGPVHPDLKYLDSGPEGVRKNIFDKIEPQTKSVG